LEARAFPAGFAARRKAKTASSRKAARPGLADLEEHLKTAVWVTSSAASLTAAVLVGTKLGRREAPTSKPPLRSTFEKLRKARRSR